MGISCSSTCTLLAPGALPHEFSPPFSRCPQLCVMFTLMLRKCLELSGFHRESLTRLQFCQNRAIAVSAWPTYGRILQLCDVGLRLFHVELQLQLTGAKSSMQGRYSVSLYEIVMLLDQNQSVVYTALLIGNFHRLDYFL